jgi:hypothetical protein
MKNKFDKWCDRMDQNLQNFQWKELLYLLFPWLKKPKNETENAFRYDVKIGNPIQIRSTKHIHNMEMLYSTNISEGTNFALDMIKVAIKKEICDEIMKGDLIEWISQDTQNGTQITGRIIVNKF